MTIFTIIKDAFNAEIHEVCEVGCAAFLIVVTKRVHGAVKKHKRARHWGKAHRKHHKAKLVLDQHYQDN